MKKLALIPFLTLIAFNLFGQWTPVASNISNNVQIQDIYAVDSLNAWAVTTKYYTGGGESLDFTRTTDDGSWLSGTINNPFAAGMAGSNICAIDGNQAWVAMYHTTLGGGGIFHTVDGGATWEHQASAEFLSPSGFPNVVHMFDANNGFCMGDPNANYFEIYTTTDGGANWTRVDSVNIPVPVADEYGIVDNYDVVGENIWFGTTSGRVFKSGDKGATWTYAFTSLPYVSDIAFIDANTGVAVGSAGSGINITTDGGNTWNEVSFTGPMYVLTLDNVPGESIVVNGEGLAEGIFYQTGSAFTKSPELGSTWTLLDDVNDIFSLSFVSKTCGWAGTHNDGDPSLGLLKFTGDFEDEVGVVDPVSNGISVFPNPAHTDINIRVNNDQLNTHYQLINIFGEEVAVGILENEITTINIQYLLNGIYFVNINGVGNLPLSFIKLN